MIYNLKIIVFLINDKKSFSAMNSYDLYIIYYYYYHYLFCFMIWYFFLIFIVYITNHIILQFKNILFSINNKKIYIVFIIDINIIYFI